MEKPLELREKIVNIIKSKGPILPVHVSKEIGTDILMASAHLAELTASKRVKISSIKVGGSPLYYLQGQEAMLQKFTGSLNDKEKKAFDLLGQNKVLRDSEQEPVIRVALREIKDFAHPLSVTYNSSTELFWKWHMVDDEEASKLIKAKLEIKSEKKEIKKEPEQISALKEPGAAAEAKPVDKQAKEPVRALPEKLPEKVQAKKIKATKEKEDLFLKDILKFFEKNNIKVAGSEIVKKNSEIDFIVDVPSVVGNLKYYCKAKNKKRISDSDLSTAYIKGQIKKLPVLVLSAGELSSKAQELLAKELDGIIFKKI